MNFADCFDAVEFLKAQQFLTDDAKFDISKDYEGVGHVRIRVPSHEFSINIEAENGYHNFDITTDPELNCRVFCNGRELQENMTHDIVSQDE